MTYLVDLFRAWWHRRCVLRLLRRMERDAERQRRWESIEWERDWLAK